MAARHAAMWAILLAAGVAGGQTPGEPTTISVMDFGAKGDGVTDDTAAFQAALDQLAPTGGTLRVPAKTFALRGHITVPGSVTLKGECAAPPSVELRHSGTPRGKLELKGTTLQSYHGRGRENDPAFIHLHANATVQGITVYYPEQLPDRQPVPYPYALRALGANVSVIDVLLVNPWQGLDLGSHLGGRHLVRGLFGQPLRRGIWVDRCVDVGRMENVHFWPFWAGADQKGPIWDFTRAQGEAFIFGRTDWQQVTGCFAINYRVGMGFVPGGGPEPPAGLPGNVLVTGGGIDLCPVAVRVSASQAHAGVSFVNAQIYGVIITEGDSGPVRFTGCGIFGAMDAAAGVGAAALSGSGRVSFSNCTFHCIDPRAKGVEAIIRANAGRVTIDGCEFFHTHAASVILDPGVRAAHVTGNDFHGPNQVRAADPGRAVLANNLENTQAAGPAPPTAPARKRR